MTFQWTFVAFVLYVEIFLICLLLLPFISPPRWQKIFRSRFCQMLSSYSNYYFNIFIFILFGLFIESIREVRKYGSDSETVADTAYAESTRHMRLFRAQRNMHISGYALFSWLIMRRLITLIAREANLMAESEASIKQAKSASAAAKLLMEERGTTDDNKKNKDKEEKTGDSEVDGKLKSKVKDESKIEVELERTKEELYKKHLEFETMKKQAESTNREYDRIVEEFSKLERKLAMFEGADAGDKKGN